MTANQSRPATPTVPSPLLTPEYQQVLDHLNSAQRLAVETIEGPVMVVAGPGTGKTQVLTTRIAYILATQDINSNNILALTFTDSAAKNMRQRLVELIGPDGYSVNICTFHAFCTQVIEDFSEFFPLKQNSSALIELEQYELLRDIFDQTELTVLKPVGDPYFHLKTAISVISQLKKEGISPTRYQALNDNEADQLKQDQNHFAQNPKDCDFKKSDLATRERNLAKNQDLQKIYQKYQVSLQERARYDFDDMVMLVIEAFQKNPHLLANYQERFQYLLVDEYQDTNSAQNQIIDLLASHWQQTANVFVVGDPNQAIYRFQGASLENVLGFKERYPQATIIHLDIGYRCPQIVYDAAETCITQTIPQSYQQPILNNNHLIAIDPQRSGHFSLMTASSGDSELIYLIEQIQKLLQNGVQPQEIALLYRNNADSERLMTILEKFDLPYEVEGGSDLLTQPLIRQFLHLLQLLANLDKPEADGKFFQLLFFPWINFDQLVAMKIGHACGQNYRLNLLKIIPQGWEVWHQNDHFDQLTQAQWQQLADFYQQLLNWQKDSYSQLFITWMEKILKESHFLDYILAQDNKRLFLLSCLNTFFDQIKALNQQKPDFGLKDFDQSLKIMQEHKLKMSVNDLNQSQNSLRLCTVHKAKGQEWNYIFMPELNDGKWGNARSRGTWIYPAGILQNEQLDQSEKNDDERRLFYVALSRAKKGVFLSFPQQLKTLAGKTQNKNASLFVTELMTEKLSPQIKQLNDQQIQTRDEDYLTKILTPATPHESSLSEKQYFTNLVENFELSATSLNNYLEDPNKFVYKDLLNIPQGSISAPQSFGTAIHATLHYLYSPLKIAPTPQDAYSIAKLLLNSATKSSSPNPRLLTPKNPPSLEKLINFFTLKMDEQLFTPKDRQLRQKQGEEIITQYYNHYFANQSRANFPQVISLEASFGRATSIVLDKDILLQGRIDRIDLLPPSASAATSVITSTTLPLARVIDYKTGRPKTDSFINGLGSQLDLSQREKELPANLQGRLKRQLLFYKILTDLDPTFHFNVVEGVFDFVELREYKNYVQRLVAFETQDLEDMKNLIRQVNQEIHQLKFLETLDFQNLKPN